MKIEKVVKGKHYSSISFSPILFPSKIEFSFCFSEKSKYYSVANTALREQWNKLGGLSFDVVGKNSARVAWRYNCENDSFEICAYFHTNGKFSAVEDRKINIQAGDSYKVKIYRYTKFAIDTIYVDVIGEYGKIKTLGWNQIPHKISLLGYNQKLYFGGHEAAPVDIEVLKF